MLIDEDVAVVEPDPRWPALFEQEKAVLASRLSGVVDLSLEHIGSTAVAGLSAKPIIDMQDGLLIYPADGNVITQLEGAGYEYLGESGVKGRQYFRKRTPFSFNLHLVALHGEHWTNNLTLRDYLRQHPEEVESYSRHKQQVIQAGTTTLLSYSAQKSEFMVALLHRAQA